MTLTKKDLDHALKKALKNVATKDELRSLASKMATKEDLKAATIETKAEIYQAIKTTKNDLLDAMRINQEHVDKSFDQMATKTDQKIDEGVYSLKVLIEAVRSDIELLAEGREPHTQRLDHHETKLDNHEGRIVTLEDYVYTKKRLLKKRQKHKNN